MKVWTHHPSTVRLDDPSLVIDWTRGLYWRTEPGYREALPILQTLLREDQFLWCCCQRGQFKRTAKDRDLVEWELNISEGDILAHYHWPTWEEIIKGHGDWKALFLPGLCHDAEVLVRFPLRPSVVVCLGQLPVFTPKARNVG